ncbi:hypothetical protein [Aquimarina rhabdastrellae]
MKKKQITVLTCLMLGLGGFGLQAQSGSASVTNQGTAEWRYNINSTRGVVIRADNNNDRSGEAIRFVVGQQSSVGDGRYMAEFNRKGLQIRGMANTDYAQLRSIRGLEIYSNSDNSSSDEPIRFRVGRNGDDRTIARMSYDNGLIVERPANFDDNAYFDRNIGLGINNPVQKIHVNQGNIRVDGGQFQSHGEIILHPDVDNTGDDAIEFRNSSNDIIAKVQDGELFLRRSGSDGGLISSNGALRFQPDNNDTGDDRISFLNQSGDEMIRMQDGVITTDQVRLNVTSFPDYVFAKDYDLMPLKEIAQYIKANKHLPNMPTEAQVVAEGMNVGQINTILVEKVEELTLHTINQEEKIEQLMKKIEALEATINK